MINIVAGIAQECKEYITKGEKRPVTCVIVPIRVLEDVDLQGRKDTIVSQGCSFHWSCENLDCTYSRASHDQAKAQKKERGNKNGD
jgi:hypothetical protein